MVDSAVLLYTYYTKLSRKRGKKNTRLCIVSNQLNDSEIDDKICPPVSLYYIIVIEQSSEKRKIREYDYRCIFLSFFFPLPLSSLGNGLGRAQIRQRGPTTCLDFNEFLARARLQRYSYSTSSDRRNIIRVRDNWLAFKGSRRCPIVATGINRMVGIIYRSVERHMSSRRDKVRVSPQRAERSINTIAGLGVYLSGIHSSD